MNGPLQKLILKKLMLQTRRRSRLWAALAALSVGTTLLLVSVMIWWNFRELLYGKHQADSLGSTFLIVAKKVTEQNRDQPNATVFTDQDIADIGRAPQVQDVGIITSNHFPVYAMMGGRLGFATDMPLESVPDKFLDKMPADWQWQPGNRSLPIIISSQFLDIYNYVFAPSQNLPQLSETAVKAIALNMKVGSGDHTETFLAHVVGFSDRIGSVLVPQSFIEYGNKAYGKAELTQLPSQLILKTQDPSDTKFAAYLDKHNYGTNSQNLRWSKVRAIVEVVTTATGILALLIMGISTLVFVLFIELTIAHAQQSLTLLLQLGHSPHYLSRFMTRQFLPLVFGAIIVSMLLATAGQAVASMVIKSQGLSLPLLPGWPVWVALGICACLLVLLVTRSIHSEIKK